MSKLLICLMGLSLGVSAADLNEVLKGRGIWWKNPAKVQDSLIKKLQDMGMRRVHIMLTDTPTVVSKCSLATLPKPSSTVNQLKTLTHTLQQKNMYIIATVYLPPTKAAVNALLDPDSGPVPALIVKGIDAIELDLEGDWKLHPPCGYTSHIAAFQDFKDRVKSIKQDMPVGITTHTSHIGEIEIPLAAADYVSLQAYSKCPASNCKAFDNYTGPGKFQKYSIGKMKNLKIPIVLGLAAYRQTWPGHTLDEAMRLALNATTGIMATDSRVLGYSYWSTSTIIKTNEAYEFLMKEAAK
ncbi:hypothetical protein EI969_18320 [Pseudomonas sp. PB101]|uniref:hypothetical protein n=1 Tax=Pseudomonas sp. PB101 TaxID=2495428 RepID=UPI001366246D|nr:hypothetical protein [Pseudomonas sp. PB101]MVW87875.1 hypothetical protein [Pseudomonas sp. PB101]